MPSKSNFLKHAEDMSRIKLLNQDANIGFVKRIDDVPRTGGLDSMPKGLLEKKSRVPLKEGTPRIYGEIVMKKI